MPRPLPLTTQEWRSIPDFSNYEVSDDGKVRRIVAACGATVGAILVPRKHKFGYPTYVLRQNGKPYYREAHRLVASAFLGPKPSHKQQVAHLDGNPKNNHFTNLVYATQLENMAHAKEHKTIACGARNGMAKLNDNIVRDIRHEYANNDTTYFVLAKKYNVTFQSIAKIITFARWKHVDA